jgi:hypothetical protein
MSVILLVDGLHFLYAGTAGGGQVTNAAVTVAGVALMHRIRKGQFTLGRLRVKGQTTRAIWNAVLSA